MPLPVIVPRQQHRISRRDVDPDALKVLYRLHEHNHTAYLVGGGVRDLLLGRKPKDFDIGTSAHPYQIKKLFRNCWIIGRRFRLAHVKFGPKTIEVATFRRVVPETSPPPPGEPEAPPDETTVVESVPERPRDPAVIHRDNTFGTPEEDAFRRDFTINGLFYDIATFSVIDYVGGLDDLEKGVVRSIGDPRVRFVEDPVRMLRAVVMAARLDFQMDSLVVDAITEHRELLATSSPARLLEEYYKILRSGFAEAIFRELARVHLLEVITPELLTRPEAVWESLARLDRYRRRFPSAPPALTNTVLIGALLTPIGALKLRPGGRIDARVDRVNFGILPVARKDIERQLQILQMLPRLLDPDLPPRLVRGLMHRPAFADGMLWLEILGEGPEAEAAVSRWQEVQRQRAAAAEDGPAEAIDGSEGSLPPRRRRRRRRRRPRGPMPQE